MLVEIDIPGTPDGRVHLGWSPVRATGRLVDAPAGGGTVTVTLRNAGTPSGGRVVFDTVRSDDDKAQIDLDLPGNGDEAEFWVAGAFQRPSSDYGDAVIEAVAGGAPLGRRELMVRVRKNAVTLTSAERDRFLAAIGTLNAAGQGIFRTFREAHVKESEDEAHGYPAFGPWHRCYLLDLERTLQEIDDTVTLPYWRFDQAAKPLFAPAFLGMPPDDPASGNLLDFPHGHSLEFWQTDGLTGIERRPVYSIDGPPPRLADLGDGPQDWVITEQRTLLLGTRYEDFRNFEGAPHGAAHSSFWGPINSVPTAARDPLFFLLHCNVDRLWAKWQWRNARWDADEADAYELSGDVREPDFLGHRPDDTMWPWNDAMGDGTFDNPRPQFPSPRTPFPDSPLVQRPGGSPRVRDMIDYQGVLGGEPLAFDYDDVPFELP